MSNKHFLWTWAESLYSSAFPAAVSSTQVSQTSPEWLAAREGYAVTSSRLAKIAGHPYASMSRAKLVKEHFGLESAAPINDFTRHLMDYGTAKEAEARSVLSALLNEEIEETGLWPHPVFGLQERVLAGSPDGLIVKNNKVYVVEIKVHRPKPLIAWEPSPLRISYDCVQLMMNMDCTNASGGYLFYYQPPFTCGKCGLLATYNYGSCDRCADFSEPQLDVVQPSPHLIRVKPNFSMLMSDYYPMAFTYYKTLTQERESDFLWLPASYSNRFQRALESWLWKTYLDSATSLSYPLIAHGPHYGQLGCIKIPI